MYHVRGEMTSALLCMNALCFDIICAPIATDAMSSLAGSVLVSSDFDFESTLSFLWDKTARTVLLGSTSLSVRSFNRRFGVTTPGRPSSSNVSASFSNACGG